MGDSTLCFRQRLWAILLAALLLAWMPAPLARADDAGANQAKLNALLAKVRAEGYPTTAGEFEKWRLEGKGQSAAEIYLKAFAAISNANGLYDGVPFLSRTREPDYLPIPAEMLDKLAAAVDANADALGLLDDAAAVKECQFPLAIQDGMMLALPHLGQLRHSARLLECRQLLEADGGQPHEAMRTQLTLLRLADALRDDPIEISQLVRASIQAMARERLEWLLATFQPTDADLADLAAELDRQIDPGARVRAVAGDRCLRLIGFDQIYALAAENENEQNGDDKPVNLPSPAQRLADKITFLEYMDLAMLKAKNPLDTRIDLDAAGKAIPVASQIVIPGAETSFFKTMLRQQAAEETARAAVAVRRYRLATGRWPEKLDDLVPRFLPSVPLDPFTGKPLLYRQTDTQVLTYSVGPDGKDDGGLREDATHKARQPGTDVAFILWKPSLPTDRLQARLDAMLAKIRAAGCSTTPAEFAQWRPEVRGENAADLYIKARDAMPYYDGIYDGVPFFSVTPEPDHLPLPVEMRNKLVAVIAANDDTLAMLDEAAKIKACQSPLDGKDGLEPAYRLIDALRPLGRLLQCRILLETDRGNAHAAIRAEIAMLRLADALRDDPLMLSQWQRASHQAMAMDRLQRLLGQLQPSESDLADLAAELDRQIDPDARRRVIVTEQYLGLAALDQLYSVSGDWPSMPPAPAAQRLADKIAFLEYIEQAMRKAKDPMDARIDLNAAANTVPESYRIALNVFARPIHFFHQLLWEQAVMETARAAVAVRRYRLATGRWPEKLDDLAPRFLPKVPLDPFANAPLHYRQTADQILLYSVGPDGKDDGGQGGLSPNQKHPMSGPGADVVFTLSKDSSHQAPGNR